MNISENVKITIIVPYVAKNVNKNKQLLTNISRGI